MVACGRVQGEPEVSKQSRTVNIEDGERSARLDGLEVRVSSAGVGAGNSLENVVLRLREAGLAAGKILRQSRRMHGHKDQRKNQRGERTLHRVPPKSEVFDFAELAVADVVDEAADDHGPGNPGMGAELLHMVADVFFELMEGVEEGGGNGGGSRAILDSGAQVLFAGVHEAAIRMVDDHEFLGPEQMMRYHKRAQRVIRDDPAGIADDVRIP